LKTLLANSLELMFNLCLTRAITPNFDLTQLVNFESDEFHSATAKNVEEAQKLVEAGFEYVCDFNGVKLFGKRK